MSNNIPFEIQAEIIKRLPVKSLMQSRSLSKPFKYLIDSSQFIADYNESRPPHLLLRYDDPLNVSDHYFQFLSIADDDSFPHHNFTTPTPHAFEFLSHIRFIGSSQGLLCFCGDSVIPGGEFPHSINQLVVIWNPSLQKYVEINVPILDDVMKSCTLGFGVHPNTNDPMIVKINDDFGYPGYIEVFMLSSRFYRSSHGTEPRKSIRFRWSQVAMDGFIYWHAIDTIKWGSLIMSFDMTSEEFKELNLPDCLVPYYQTDKSLSLAKLSESLVVLEYYKDAEKPVCDVWKMTNGITKSFAKLFTISVPLFPLKKILGFRKTRESIIGKLMDGHEESTKLEVYHTSVEEIKNYVINGEVGLFFVSSYKETLLLHDHKNRDYIPMNFNSIKS